MFLVIYFAIAVAALAGFVSLGLAWGWQGRDASDYGLFLAISGMIALLWLPVATGLGLALGTALLFRAIGPRPQLAE